MRRPSVTSFPCLTCLPQGRLIMNDLHGKRVLVTAGPTWVPLDAVRFLTNFSSGQTGLTIARRLAARGAAVTLLLGPGRAVPTAHDREALTVQPFTTFDDLHGLVRHALKSGACDVMIHTAAVADYRPAEVREDKIPSGSSELVIRLRPLPKIVDEVKALAPSVYLVKFKLEVGRTREQLIEIARHSRERSHADLIVANDKATFAPGRHPALILDAVGIVAETGTQEEMADRLAEILAVRARREVGA